MMTSSGMPIDPNIASSRAKAGRTALGRHRHGRPPRAARPSSIGRMRGREKRPDQGTGGGRKSLSNRRLLAVGCLYADLSIPGVSRCWPSACRPASAGVMGKSALATEDRLPAHYKAFTAALAAIEANYAEPVESDRLVYGAHQRHAADARSAFELHGPAHLRPDARAAGAALLRPRHHHPVGRSQHHRGPRVRRIAGPPEGPAPRRRHRQDRRAGPHRLDHRTGRDQAARTRRARSSTSRSSAAGVDDLLVDGRDARPGHHPEHPGPLHHQGRRRLHPPRGLRRAHRRRTRRGARRPDSARA